MRLAIFSILGLGLCVSLTVAQSLSQCATACISQAAAKDGCVSFTNLTCVCKSAQFQQDARSCLTAECSSSDLTTLEGLQAQECGALQLSATGTPSDTATFTASGISSGSGTSVSVSSTTVSTVSGSASTSGSGTIVPPPSSVISSAVSTASSTGSSATSSATSNSAQNLQIPLGMSFVALLMALEA